MKFFFLFSSHHLNPFYLILFSSVLTIHLISLTSKTSHSISISPYVYVFLSTSIFPFLFFSLTPCLIFFIYFYELTSTYHFRTTPHVGEIAGEQDFSVDPYEPHPDFRFSKGAIMSENEWIDLSDNMEKNDGYVKRDAQAMKERPGKYISYVYQ